MCRVLDVSRGGYYDWHHRPDSKRAERHKDLVSKIEAIHEDNHDIYGSPRIHRELVGLGEIVGENTIASLMKANGIQSKVHKRFVITTRSRNDLPAADNILKRNFATNKINKKWVSDVTFIPTREGSFYLATVMDLCSRRIVGWSMSRYNNVALVSNALKMAIEHRGCVAGLILHSDRGATYKSPKYLSILDEHGIVCSMSRKGNCWDNAVMESFYHSVKSEWMVFEDYHTRDQARRSLFDYIELFYNRKRRHSTLDYVSPVTFEESVL
jgi:transposase InsO family protein